MKNLLFNSLLIVSIFLIASCSYSNQTSTETASQDTASLAAADTTVVGPAEDTIQAVAFKGDSVAAQSTRVESTEPGTVNKHPGAVHNPGANQVQTDSIKQAKTKGKKMN